MGISIVEKENRNISRLNIHRSIVRLDNTTYTLAFLLSMHRFWFFSVWILLKA